MNTKRCKACGRELSLDQFGSHYLTKDGKQSVCRTCMASYVRNAAAKRKVCSCCGKEKALFKFHRHAGMADGRQKQCKMCKARYAKYINSPTIPRVSATQETKQDTQSVSALRSALMAKLAEHEKKAAHIKELLEAIE